MEASSSLAAGLKLISLVGNETEEADIGGGQSDLTKRWTEASPDGEEWPPFYTVFKNPPRIYVAACCISLFLAVANLIGFALFFRRIQGCPSSERRGLFVRISCLIPVFAVASCLALAFPKIGVFFALIRDAYTGLSVLWFSELMVEMLGGFHSACVEIASTTVEAEEEEKHASRASLYLSESVLQAQPSVRLDASHRSIPMDEISRSAELLVGVWYGASQYAYSNVGLGLLWCVLAGLGWYEEGILPSHWLLLTLKVLQLLSSLAAMAAAAVQYSALHGPLLRAKFASSYKLLSVVLAVLFCNSQPFVCSLLFLDGDIPNTALFATRARSALWNSFLLSWEASALLLLLVHALPIRELFDPEVRAPLKGEGFDWDLTRLSLFPVRSYGSVGRPARFTTSAVPKSTAKGHWSGSSEAGGARPLVAARNSYPQYEQQGAR